MKKFLKDYFSFSRKERIAIFILLGIIGMLWVIPEFFSIKKRAAIKDPLLDSLVLIMEKHQKDSSILTENIPLVNDKTVSVYKDSGVILFHFDPNTLDATGWKRLGIRDKTVRTILNYRNKGGKFRKPEDIRKIWGLQKEEADRIIPWAEIRDAIGNTTLAFTSKQQKQVQTVDINTASAKDFMQLPGIDPALAYRMVRFRDKLGGFFSIEQLKETYGLQDTLYKQIASYLTFNQIAVKKININTASEAELNAHPYLKREIAKAIILYREQHGIFTNIEAIRKIGFISEEIIRKIVPYLTVE